MAGILGKVLGEQSLQNRLLRVQTAQLAGDDGCLESTLIDGTVPPFEGNHGVLVFLRFTTKTKILDERCSRSRSFVRNRIFAYEIKSYLLRLLLGLHQLIALRNCSTITSHLDNVLVELTRCNEIKSQGNS